MHSSTFFVNIIKIIGKERNSWEKKAGVGYQQDELLLEGGLQINNFEKFIVERRMGLHLIFSATVNHK